MCYETNQNFIKFYMHIWISSKYRSFIEFPKRHREHRRRRRRLRQGELKRDQNILLGWQRKEFSRYVDDAYQLYFTEGENEK